MLRLRILTALLLFPLTVYITMSAPPEVFITLCAIIFLIAANEWGNLIGLQASWQRIAFMALLTLTFIATNSLHAKSIFGTALFWWCLALIWIALYPSAVKTWNHRFILIILGIEVLMPSWLALVTLRYNYGPLLVIYMLCLIWVADIGAYTVGRLIGKNKLAPHVSPGKTIEGAIAGVVCSMLVAIAAMYYFKVPASASWAWLCLAMATALISIVGDLLVSMLKRNRGVKDSGRLLPGHGGLLDRIDSLTAAAPLFTFGMLYYNFPGDWL